MHLLDYVDRHIRPTLDVDYVDRRITPTLMCLSTIVSSWIFPAASKAGHMDAPREQHRPNFAFGNALRRTYRTHAVRAEINPLLVKVLLNHEIGRDVHDGYFSTPSMFRELLVAQERLSDHLVSHATTV